MKRIPSGRCVWGFSLSSECSGLHTRLAALLCGVLLAVLTPAASQAQEPAAAPTLLLIGIDGLRWDIIDRHPAPVLQALAAGASVMDSPVGDALAVHLQQQRAPSWL